MAAVTALEVAVPTGGVLFTPSQRSVVAVVAFEPATHRVARALSEIGNSNRTAPLPGNAASSYTRSSTYIVYVAATVSVQPNRGANPVLSAVVISSTPSIRRRTTFPADWWCNHSIVYHL